MIDIVAWNNILNTFDLPQREFIQAELVSTYQQVVNLLEEWWQTQATQREGYAQAVRDGVIIPNTSFREWAQKVYGNQDAECL